MARIPRVEFDGRSVICSAAALYQLGFGWIAFARGLGRPRPPAVEAVVAVAVFGLVAVPALFLWGRGAYVAAMKFYENNGYRKSGQITDFFGMPLVEYVKELN